MLHVNQQFTKEELPEPHIGEDIIYLNERGDGRRRGIVVLPAPDKDYVLVRPQFRNTLDIVHTSDILIHL